MDCMMTALLLLIAVQMFLDALRSLGVMAYTR